MTKKHFIAMADEIRRHNEHADPEGYTTSLPFSRGQIDVLADFCRSQNSNFNRDRWLDYIAGNCGPNGGTIKTMRPPAPAAPASTPLETIGMT